jgi:hypothetical protein
MIPISRWNNSGCWSFEIAGKALLSWRRLGHAAGYQSQRRFPDPSLLLVSNEGSPTTLLIGCPVETHLMIVFDRSYDRV